MNPHIVECPIDVTDLFRSDKNFYRFHSGENMIDPWYNTQSRKYKNAGRIHKEKIKVGLPEQKGGIIKRQTDYCQRFLETRVPGCIQACDIGKLSPPKAV
jgi:hypothetical protein